MPLFSLVSVVTVAQRTADPVAPPPAPADAEWRWLGMQVVIEPDESGGMGRNAWHTFGLYRVAACVAVGGAS